MVKSTDFILCYFLLKTWFFLWFLCWYCLILFCKAIQMFFWFTSACLCVNCYLASFEEMRYLPLYIFIDGTLLSNLFSQNHPKTLLKVTPKWRWINNTKSIGKYVFMILTWTISLGNWDKTNSSPITCQHALTIISTKVYYIGNTQEDFLGLVLQGWRKLEMEGSLTDVNKKMSTGGRHLVQLNFLVVCNGKWGLGHVWIHVAERDSLSKEQYWIHSWWVFHLHRWWLCSCFFFVFFFYHCCSITSTKITRSNLYCINYVDYKRRKMLNVS